MIMSKSAPLVSAIFFSNIVFLFKDLFLIVWSMNESSSADSLSGLMVLPEGRECGCGPARAASPIWVIDLLLALVSISRITARANL
jgi:hypothetical protein